MSADRCPRCNCGELVQFQSKGKADRLPQVCRSCSCIVIDGRALTLPEGFEDAALEMVDASAHAAKKAREGLEKDPEQRIEDYMARRYREAYMDGFVRALAWWTHHGKEGRLKRLREIWDKCVTRIDPNEYEVGFFIPKAAYTEFEQLLHMSPGATNGQSPKNKRTSIPKSPA